MPRLDHVAPLALVALVTLAGCREASGTPGDAGTAPSASASPPPSAAAPTAAPSASPDDAPVESAGRKHPEVREAHFCSDVKNKEPVDNLDFTKPGKRVYAHLLVRNRTSMAHKLTLTFFVDGVERSKTELDVERSWAFRTWAYVTLKPTDTGKLRMIVTDDVSPESIARLEIPIRP
jgi:hypothetical protein